MKKITIFIFSINFLLPLSGQKRLLDERKILTDVNECITATYNFRFEEAHRALARIEDYSSDHPSVLFLKAFVIYWENFPLIPGDEKEDEFLFYIEDCIKTSETWIKNNENELEAVFFDLFSRAFYAMYWADNGKPGKVFPHINSLYKYTVKGMEMKEDFNEFYFTTGLYNYYIEAYPEKHPSFKPLVYFFQDGNKNLGLKQLDYCADNAIFLRIEAKFFLSLIYLNYEEDLNKASEYAAELYKEFPENIFYTGKYLEILLYNEKYFLAPILLNRLKKWNDPFSQMQYHLYNAYFLEKAKNKVRDARKEYKKALEISENFGEFTGTYNAIAYMGLGRYYESKGNKAEANRYFRRAKNETSYEYIINER